jgi:hypothetical protein
MASNITTYQGRRCTKVRRSGETAVSSVASAAALSSKSTGLASTVSANAASRSSSVISNVGSSTTLVDATAPPTPVPPPPPLESETGPASVVRSMLTPAASTVTPKASRTPTVGGATGGTAPVPTPVPPPPPTQSVSEETTRPDISQKSILLPSEVSSPQSTLQAPTPTPGPPPPPIPVASSAVASNPQVSNAQPNPSISAGQRPTIPAPQGPQASQNPVSTRRGGNPQNTLPASSPASPGQSNVPVIVPGSPAQPNDPAQPNSPSQPNGPSFPGQSNGPTLPDGGGGGQGGEQQPGNIPEGGNGVVPPGSLTVVPFPAVMTSVPVARASVVVTTAKNGLPTTFTIPASSVNGAQPGSTAGAGHGPGLPGADGTHAAGQSSKKVNGGAIGGAVAGVLGIIVIVALVWFCGRKAARKRKRGSLTPLMNRDSGLRTKTSLSEKLSAFVGRGRTGDATTDGARRSNTPALERGMREQAQDATRNRSSRASSAPAVSFRERALGALAGKKVVKEETEQEVPRRLPTPVPDQQHRRSASVSSFIQSWSATDENNNPFRDPDTREPLRLINADLSRSNTRGTIRQAPAAVLTPSPRRVQNPFASPHDTPVSPPPVGPLPSRPMHKRSFSQNRIDPFADPANEISPVSPQRTEAPQDYMNREAMIARAHSQARSIASQSRGGSQHQRQPSKSSTIDSGFVSGASPQIGSADSERPWKETTNSPRTQYPLSTVLSSRSSSSSNNSSPVTSPSHHSSHRSSKAMSYDFGPDHVMGSSPGPTRPTTSMFPSYIENRISHVSDPFDLDRPEVLAFMKDGRSWTGSREPSLSRSGSARSSRSKRRSSEKGATATGGAANNGTNWYMNSTTTKPI